MPIKLWVVITSGQIDDQRRVEPSNWFYTLKNVDLSMHFNITNWKPQVLKIYTSPWGRWESDMTERLSFHFSLSCIGEGNGSPLQCSCLENPRDGGAWWAAISGVAQSRTQLKRLSSSSSSSGSPLNSLGSHPNQLLHPHPTTIRAFPRPFLPPSLSFFLSRLWSNIVLIIYVKHLNTISHLIIA